MATFAWTDCRLEINSVNLSAHARSVTLELDVAELDDTAFGDTYHSRIGGGLKDWTVTVEWNQDHAASAVDATLFTLHGTTTTVKVRPTTSAISSTNPEFTGAALVKYSPMTGGEVGSLGAATSTLLGAGTLSRNTT